MSRRVRGPSRARVYAVVLLLLSTAAWPSVGGASDAATGDELVPLPPIEESVLFNILLEQRSAELADLVETEGALGMYRRDDGAVVVVVPASGSSTFSALDALALGITVAVETRDIEVRDVALIRERVAAHNWDPARGVARPVTLFDPETGKVRIYSDAPASEFADLFEAFPDKIDYPGRGITAHSRMADFESHWGGARMVSPQESGFCSSGFSVNNAAMNPRMVTAAHCWELGYTVDSPQGSSFGEVKKRDNYPTNDFELVGGFGIGQGPSIYVGDSVGTQRKVSSAGLAGQLVEYCFSGARTYQNCPVEMVTGGESVDLDYTDDGVTTDVQIFEGPIGRGSCPGDSGAPFFLWDVDGRVMIRGIVVAGEEFLNDPTGSICDANARVVVVETWPKIRDTYNVTIKTGT